MSETRRFLATIAALTSVTLFGAVGYRAIEGASWGDAFYMTIITLSTVGYDEVVSLGPAGRLFTAILISVGIILVFGLAGVWVRVIFEGQLEEAIGRRRRGRVLANMKDHMIVCGHGRFGSQVVQELGAHREKFVVIDPNADIPPGVVAIRDDATEEAVLREAQVSRARVLLAALPSDADNVYITLTAKEINPDIFIIARCGAVGAERRLLSAGASRVVTPYALSASRMVALALNPALVDVDDLVAASGRGATTVAEIAVGKGTELVGTLLHAAPFTTTHGVVPVGVLDEQGRLNAGLVGSYEVGEGDIIVVLGPHAAVEALAARCQAKT
jgi:voltage-gated potassium channel